MPKPETRKLTIEEQMEDFNENVIGTEEAARLLGTTQQHVQLLIRESKIVGKKVGHRDYAVFKPSVLEYRENRSGRGRPPSKAPRG